ncbi:MAG TPA: S-layer homology domain-containing protein [Bacillota bacterium]|nr:S-layer homology domain-containing protein [Bacillota bacterium]HQE65495.1 S-layer homology domain-containing protein [Bacillota bacterium]HQI15841.1 S-layer homology domain-containing protein [Bacillota bacterium]
MYKQAKALVSVLLISALMFAPIQPAAVLHADTPAPVDTAAPNQAALTQDNGPLIELDSMLNEFNSEKLPYVGDRSGPIGKLTNTKAVLKENVHLTLPNALSAIAPERKGLIKKSSLANAVDVTKLQKGEVILDKKAGKAVKIIGVDDQGDFAYDEPQIYEVFEDLEIPRQTVNFTTANVIGSIVPYKIVPATPYLESLVKENKMVPIVQTPLSGQRSASSFGVMEYSFDNYEVDFPLSGGSVKITLDGSVRVAAVQLTAEYDFFDGYDFCITTGEEINLTAKASVDINEEFAILLFGLGTPTDDGSLAAGAGIYLMGNINGEFSLFVSFGEGLCIGAGIRGSTFFGVPVSFHPYLVSDCYVRCDADFFGKVSASLGFGPKIYARIFGITLVDLELRLAGIIDTTIDEGYMNIDIDGWVRLYLNILGFDTDLINKRWSFLEKRKKDTKGFDIKIDTACGYRDYVSGTIQEDKGTEAQQAGVLENYTGNITVVVRRGDNQVFEWPSFCNDGVFSVDLQNDAITPGFSRINIIKDDKISIRVPEKGAESEYVNPTNPFKHIAIDYADFFNDTLQGTVSPVQIGVQEDGRPIFEEYNKDIYIKYFVPYTQDTKEFHCVSQNGKFNYDYDFKPGHNVTAELRYDGWTVRSDMTSVWHGLVFTLLPLEVVDETEGSYYDNYEFLYVRGVNTRGTKPLENLGVEMKYWLTVPLPEQEIRHYISEWSVLIIPVLKDSITEREIPLKPLSSNPSLPDPTATARDVYICRWTKPQAEDGSDSTGAGITAVDRKKLNKDMGLSSGSSMNIGLTLSRDLILGTNDAATLTDTDLSVDMRNVLLNNMDGLTPSEEEIRNQWKDIDPDYRFDTDIPPLDPDSDELHSIFLTFGFIEYEGAVIATVSNYSGGCNYKPELHQQVMDQQFIEQVIQMAKDDAWVTHPETDPNELLDISKLKERYTGNIHNEIAISNKSELSDWAAGPAEKVAGWGIIDLERGNTFPGDRLITKGELVAYLSRMFGLESSGKALAYKDIRADYKYRNEIAAAYEAGIIDGKEGSLFNPDAVLTIEGASIIIHNAMSILLGNAAINEASTSSRTFANKADISPDAMEAVGSMAAIGLYEGFADTSFKPKSGMTMEQTAVMLNNMINKLILR